MLLSVELLIIERSHVVPFEFSRSKEMYNA